MGNQPVVFLGSRSVICDLFEKRGRIYSSRPRMVMASEIMTHGDHVVFMPYGPQWRKHHRIQGALLNQQAVRHYRKLLDLESLFTLRDILAKPDNIEKAFRRYPGSLMNTLAYGEPTVSHCDAPQLKQVENIARAFADAVGAGHWLVDAFPILKWFPNCVAPWNRYGEQIHQRTVQLFREKTTAAETAPSWNWVKHAKGEYKDEMSDHEFLYVIGVLYQAGVHVTVSTLRHLLFICCRYSVSVATAQRELDSVLAPDQLPTTEDLRSLPYVSAFIKEVLRWRPLTPIGMPHASTEDDSYGGYHLPRGTVFIPNHWALDIDELGGDSQDFRPERWLQCGAPMINAFGFGRRVCPGQHLAQDAVSLLVSRLLWAFSFQSPDELSSWGFEIDASILVPKPFRANVTIRDERRKDTINHGWRDSDKDFNSILEQIGREMS
ncbi:hypothetical protein N7471_007062 [Penicillium samsonianum]|uniref:uncharacterized protein n=1 Tax=Penicillium samsonianum TaxID=1882272 RepID=UPI00254670AB|nr:uncharacterized protein N7471_007062 [Penicillium samsonianum]KAJ6131847.1 hypothetical protein N7471_007062 [Penicillium samsonianum]